MMTLVSLKNNKAEANRLPVTNTNLFECYFFRQHYLGFLN